MQPALRSPIPDGLLAALAVNGEKPHQGLPGRNPAPYPAREACNSTVQLGLRGLAALNRVGSRCTGKERDTESGNDYFGARYYASTMGRWLSPEYSMNGVLLELPQSWNKYNYVLNRPLYASDPDGRCPWCVGAIVGGVVEGGIDLGKQYFINGHGSFSNFSWSEFGGAVGGGAIGGALAVATGGTSLVANGLIGDITAGVTANIVGGIATRGLTSLFSGGQGSEGILGGGEISLDAVTGFVGGGLGHLAGDVIHVPDEPIHNGRGSVGAIRRDDAKFANYNSLLRQQITRATITGSAVNHTPEGSLGLWDFMFGPPPPPTPPPPPPPPCATTSATDSVGNTTGTSGCQ